MYFVVTSKSHPSSIPHQAIAAEKATAMFDQVDQDGDGELDEHEFIKSLPSFSICLIFFFFRIFSLSFLMITTCLSPIFFPFSTCLLFVFSLNSKYYNLPLHFLLLILPQGMFERSRLCSNPERCGSRSWRDGGWVGGGARVQWQQKMKKKK